MEPVFRIIGTGNPSIRSLSAGDKVLKAKETITLAKQKAQQEIELAEKLTKEYAAQMSNTVLFKSWSEDFLRTIYNDYTFAMKKLMLEGEIPPGIHERDFKEQRLEFFKEIIQHYELDKEQTE